MGDRNLFLPLVNGELHDQHESLVTSVHLGCTGPTVGPMMRMWGDLRLRPDGQMPEIGRQGRCILSSLNTAVPLPATRACPLLTVSCGSDDLIRGLRGKEQFIRIF